MAKKSEKEDKFSTAVNEILKYIHNNVGFRRLLRAE